MTRLFFLLALAFGAGYAVPVAAGALTAVSADASPDASPALSVVSPPASDPVDDPSGWWDALRAGWAESRVVGVLVALLAALRLASSRVPWLRAGRRVAYVGAGTALLTSLIATWPGNLAHWVGWLVPAVLAVVLMFFQPGPAEGRTAV
jgi:hypothetical protein